MSLKISPTNIFVNYEFWAVLNFSSNLFYGLQVQAFLPFHRMVTVLKHLLCANYVFLKVSSLMMCVLTAIAMTKRISCTARMSIMKNAEKAIVIHNMVKAVILVFSVSPLPSL